MASPFGDSHETKTMDIPLPSTERERPAGPSHSWLPVAIVVGALVLIALLAIVVLTG